MLVQAFKKSCQYSAFPFIFLVLLSSNGLALSPLPSGLGKTKEISQGSNGKTLILIEEAHVDYGAQKAIAEILRRFIERDGVRLILVEGGWGKTNLSYLRAYATPGKRHEVAERFLKAGKISGEEYLDLTSDLPLDLWGIEAPQLYAANMEAFLKLQSESGKIKEELDALGKIFAQLQDKILKKQTAQLFKKHQAFARQAISWIDYAQALKMYADPATLSACPLFNQFLKNFGAETALDLGKVELEKQRLIRQLSRRLTKPEFEALALLEKHENLEEELQGLKTMVEIYHAHPQLKNKVNISNLQKYIVAIQESIALDGTALFNEIEAIESQVFERLLQNDEERNFLNRAFAFETLRNLFELKMTPKEFEKIEKFPQHFELLSWQTALTPSKFPDMVYLQNQMLVAKTFYTSAKKREQAFMKNAVEKIKQTNSSTSAMIVGGFHTETMTDFFVRQGYHVVRVSPRFDLKDAEDHQKQYLDILSYKWKHKIVEIPTEDINHAVSTPQHS